MSFKHGSAKIFLFLVFILCSFRALSASLMEINKVNEEGSIDYADDSLEIVDISDFYKRVFGDSYDTNWDSLIKKYGKGATVDTKRLPYLDSWYPEKSGGTNVNINSSEQAVVKDKIFIDDPNIDGALDKYDMAFYSGKKTAAKWELENHTRKEPSWFGHCNGTSAAVARFQNPRKSVYRPKGCRVGSSSCIKFTPQDIRALLSEISMNAKAKFISGNRCSKSKKDIEEESRKINAETMDACQDVNPATFHIALVNFLARKKQTLIFDKSMDAEVWNYPIYKYAFSYEKKSLSSALKELGVSASRWVFNPNAKDFVRVSMNVYYRDPLTRNFKGAGSTQTKVNGENTYKIINYGYILELDANDNIIGGEWSKDSYKKHPDFIWMPFEPAAPTGNTSKGNPEISNEHVISMWAESMSFDEEDPFRSQPQSVAYDIRFYPTYNADNWGEDTGYYQVYLNGINAPYVFRDGSTSVSIESAGKLKDGAKFKAYLNSKLIAYKALDDGKAVFTAKPIRGLNELKIVWSEANIDTVSLNWTYYLYSN